MTGSAQIVVNGLAHELALEPDRSLLYALREEFGLTGAKPGCGEGACGACTVLLDGKPVRACTVDAADAAGHVVTSVEGLASDGRLHPVQRAFVQVGAFQCGYCTAGMIMSTVALLAADGDPDDAQIRTALAGNVCRCCTYPRILRAVHRAAELARDEDGRTGPEPLAASAGLPAASARPRQPWDLTPALGTRLLRSPARWAGRGPGAGQGAGRPRVVGWLDDQHRGVAPPGRARNGDGVHRQGRRRPGQPDCALPARRRGAAGSPRRGPAGDGRHRRLPLRRRHVRQPLDARCGRAPAPDRRVCPRVPARPCRCPLACRRRRARRSRRLHSGGRRQALRRLRGARAWHAARGGHLVRCTRHARPGGTAGRTPDPAGRRRGDRDGRQALPIRPVPSGHAPRPCPASAGVRRDASFGRRHESHAAARRDRRARGRVRGRGCPGFARGSPRVEGDRGALGSDAAAGRDRAQRPSAQPSRGAGGLGGSLPS